MSDYPFPCWSWLMWFPPYRRFKRAECRAQGIDPDTGETLDGLERQAAMEIEVDIQRDDEEDRVNE